ncbi:hypothetical protein AURANDRAFT_70080 [Aureococcus anophagefferens]|uniref:PCI domain-containing protein n=1 Tax=Aureococcus anophagefferens TaxID=44056 RepID=F0Y1W5_AURAN|nr:hypothetical protein AURANDRAFT_70080 [Aureococcus anophagefferens]EGB10589.1 hypothetical protein AURANDRAFT_70080 [Aureococcus anophagefferens]|eukprot:XP_009034199.1 hypothetical protein AURANDRAFT_70080 [Aureococcus anophagefferens]
MAKDDVEMKDAKDDGKKDDDATVEEPPAPPDLLVAIEKNVVLIEKAVETSQTRLMMRALRNNGPIRKKADAEVLGRAVRKLLGHGGDATQALVAAALAADVLPEVEIYVLTLCVSTLVRGRDFAAGAALSALLIPRLRAVQALRRALDPLSAKVYFYFALCHEKLGKFDDVRAQLFAAHRTAVLQHHEFSAAVLLNGLLRGMLEANLVEAALKLVSKTTFPETASNNQFCRYLYYTGRIQAIQLDYSDAFTKLMQSSRKAPANTALGFRLQVTKLTLLVQLLMGEIPDRSAFDGEGMRGELEPYLKLTQAVRRGDLLAYNKVVADYGAKFARDKTASLVRRLSQNVVKTGLRRINVSYSRISLEDVKTKLHLDSVRSAEFVCAKAIKDGVIDAVIDHDNACVKSKDVADIYSTIEPQKAFHRRVVFCLDVHNEAVKAMQYPPDAHKPKKALEDGEEAKDDEKQTDEELAKEIEEELGDEM